MEFERSRRFLRMIRYLRGKHPRGILHFQRSVQFEVVVGCSKHQDFEVYAHVDEMDDLVAVVDLHLESFHEESKSWGLTLRRNPC